MTQNPLTQGADSFFADLENDSPYLKACAEGLAKSGKTFTLALIAVGLHRHIKSEKPIVIFDTENAAKFLKPMFETAGIPVKVKSPLVETLNSGKMKVHPLSLPDLQQTMEFCSNGLSDILFIDSMTHVWRYFLEDYQRKLGRTRLEFQDWNIIKPAWSDGFTLPFVNSPIHILFTGRQGYTYDYEEIDGRKTLVKTGIKMKVETETAFEPDLVLHMERFEQLLKGSKKKKVWRECTVIGSRFHPIDGKVFTNPTYKNFEPMVKFLLKDIVEKRQLDSVPNAVLFGQEENNSQERKDRRIQLERNQNYLDKIAPGTSGAAKALKLRLLERAYVGETSETAIGAMTIGQLEAANETLHEYGDRIEVVQRLEKKVFATDKLSLAERVIRFGSDNLAEAPFAANLPEESLNSYIQYLSDKVITAQNEKNGKDKEADEKPTKETTPLSEIGKKKKTESPVSAATK